MEGVETHVQGRNILMIDFMNMVFRNLHVAFANNPLDKEFKDWKQMMLHSTYLLVRKFDTEQLLMLHDEGSSWRKKVYSEYKAPRAAGRDASPIDFDAFWKVMDEWIADFKEALPNVYFLHYNSYEADDFIGVLTKELEGNNIVNVSTDKDLYQLYKYKGYKQYNPIKRQFVKMLNPTADLQIKILVGDKSDNIPQVKKGVGPKTAEKILKDLDGFLNESGNEEYKKQYILNKQLIDLELIPNEIKNNIKKLYYEADTQPFNGRLVYNFFSKKMPKALSFVQEFNECFKKLKSFKELKR